jgi:hypothetical protein
MFVRITALAVILVLAASVAIGIPFHPSERGCTTPSVEVKNCDQMESEPVSPGITPFGLCCLIDCQEPGPTGTAVTVRVPSFSGAFLDQVVLQSPLALPKPPPPNWVQTSSFTPPETYLKNLALLI